jgi:hypothetical protein
MHKLIVIALTGFRHFSDSSSLRLVLPERILRSILYHRWERVCLSIPVLLNIYLERSVEL